MPTPRIAPEPWMTAPETGAVMDALAADGAEARFVGGCVRDLLAKRPVKDIDIATHETPERVIALLERAGIRAIPTGIDHGTVTAVIGDAHFEITTLRIDVQTYGRRADVAFTDDWAEDAARRDFTINAMSLARDGTLHDPFGGLADLKAGRVRFVGDARARIREDVLRLLRFFRFYASYGRGAPDGDALAAAGELAHLVPGLSGERVWSELRRILIGPGPVPVLQLMARAGVLAHVVAEAHRFGRLAALLAIEAEEGTVGDEDAPGGDSARGAGGEAVLRLAAVIEADAARAEAIAGGLRLSARARDRLALLADGRAELGPGPDPVRARAEAYRLGNALYADTVLLAWAEARAAGEAGLDAAAREALAIARTWPRPRLPVKGADALALGLEPGPKVGEAVAAVEAWWIAEDFAPDRKACLERLEQVTSRRG